MAGINLGVMGGVRVGGHSMSTSTASPSTATEAGFGSAYGGIGPTPVEALKPNDPFGVAFWFGVGSLALLLLIRNSLPA